MRTVMRMALTKQQSAVEVHAMAATGLRITFLQTLSIC
jgi:hypothetical protein